MPFFTVTDTVELYVVFEKNAFTSLNLKGIRVRRLDTNASQTIKILIC